MADQPTIRIVIPKEGEIEISVEGALGNKCKELCKPFLENMGVIVDMQDTLDAFSETTNIEENKLQL